MIGNEIKLHPCFVLKLNGAFMFIYACAVDLFVAYQQVYIKT